MEEKEKHKLTYNEFMSSLGQLAFWGAFMAVIMVGIVFAERLADNFSKQEEVIIKECKQTYIPATTIPGPM